jgi:hypothetical protein
MGESFAPKISGSLVESSPVRCTAVMGMCFRSVFFFFVFPISTSMSRASAPSGFFFC